MEDLTLIKCVKKYPQVYDSTTQEFKSLEEKEKAWRLISNELKFDADSCKKRWRTLRERFTRELRKCYLDQTKSNYEYFDLISSFLSSHIKFRSIETKGDMVMKKDLSKVYSKLIKPEPENTIHLYEAQDGKEYIISDDYREVDQVDADQEYEEFEEQESQLEDVLEPQSHQIDPSPTHSNLEFSKTSTPRNSGGATKRRAESPVYQLHQQQQQDEHSSFGLAIASELSKLSRLNNIRAKVEIFKILEKFVEIEESAHDRH